jgi:hypothetical protein
LRAALCAGLRRKEEFFPLLTRHLFLSAQARLGNVPGYYRSSLTGLGYCGREFVVFLNTVRRGDPTPGASPGVSFFVVQARRETEARQGFRAAGLRRKEGLFLSLPTLSASHSLASRVGSIMSRHAALGQCWMQSRALFALHREKCF